MDTKQPPLKPITRRAYKILVNKVYRAESALSWTLENDPTYADKKKTHEELKAKLDAYSEDCPGEAHSNAFIDNCGICAPQWGKIQRRDLRKVSP